MKHILSTLLGITLLISGCRSPVSDDSKTEPSAGKTYSVNVKASQNGVITAKPSSAVAGTEIILQVSPKAGYRLTENSIKIKSSASETTLYGDVRSFILPPRDVTITGDFEDNSGNTYSISAAPDARKHGLIIPSPEFCVPGDTVFFAVVPDEGYRYKQGSLKASNGVIINEVSRTLVMPQNNVTVDAEFEPVPAGVYTVRVNSAVNGRIFARPEEGPEGTGVFLQVIADPGYVLKTGTLKYQVAGKEQGINETLRATTIPNGHILVSGEFEKLPANTYSIGIENQAHGHIFSESKYGALGNKITLQVYPDLGYRLKPGTLKYQTTTGIADIISADLTFEMPGDNIMIQGEFIALERDVFSAQVGMFNNGKITAFPEYGKKDTNVYLRIKPDIGYQIKPGSLRYVDSTGQEVVVGEDVSFLLPASHVRIKAEFEPLSANIFSIQIGDTTGGHIITTPGSGKEETAISVWVMPDSGYYYKKGTLKYTLIPANVEFPLSDESRTFKLNASNVQVMAEFVKVPINNFTIRAAPADHGMIYCRQDYGYSGQYVEMVIRPDPGYQIKAGSLQYQDSNNSIVKFNGTSTGFNMPREHVTVYGEFEAIKYSVNADSAIKNGSITITPQRGTIGSPVKLAIIPKNGYRLTPNSLKYRITRNNTETAINEQTREFSMPPENILILAQFEPYSALGDLKINNRDVKGLARGKTDYTIWIPHDEKEARITFTTEQDITVSPASGETVTLDAMEKKQVVFTVISGEGKVKTDYTISVIRELIPTRAVPAGSFQRENNSNSISLVSSFRMGEREVTQEEWNKVMSFPRGTEGNTYPAHHVSWYEAVVFCNKLSILEGKDPAYMINNSTDPDKWGKIPNLTDNFSWYVSCKWDADGYRLPTEMEWHWAAMGADSRLAGMTNTAGYEQAFAGIAPNVSAAQAAWYKDNSNGIIHPVGEKEANALGLRDMSGNVTEWCWDWVNNNYQKNYGMGGRQTNYRGGNNNTGNKMRRGGSYLSEESTLVLNYRGNESGAQVSPFVVGDPRANDEYVGLRIVYPDQI
ncbi:MAG: SUMF1/EgtB/PvdO family nonheme iron enzyme [Treponema sp.]|jgi:formylglycine-generating enzyme required for sulfatase activity|nr:SUMF1/EgtB/PvdO family nonheme iron enzyme [Treponema sp.]